MNANTDGSILDEMRNTGNLARPEWCEVGSHSGHRFRDPAFWNRVFRLL
jgi:hypothetical protein